ncbi:MULTISPECIES: peptidoglycan DD-metalloendopeptidase family protein [unclassified Acinetobacter]|uniref:peptidoglycan DD-metalloendopeptidase family protein n=1 Tax=unclassified Acinetobacter TaxID=196816 RepID=UPI00045136EC|nr:MULTISPECIES: peptidoglycan DD-metalloendopeptidase family protein [unclassified Acinetobacter]EZQ01073.1 peptidoglycan-binding protein [Acinetobacter sp. Ver3]SEL26585.1 lipoprotein NlpD [Acinetobacter sp. DSM 11652]
MLLARPKTVLKLSKPSIHSALIAVAVASFLGLSGCASKPQIHNSARYAVAPDFYTVRSGDTLSKIAARYGLSYLSIAEMNDIAPPYRIYVNQSLRLKPSGNRQVTRSTTRPLTATETQIQRQTIQLPTKPAVGTPPPQTTPVPAVTAAVPTTSTKATSLRWVKPSNGPVIENFNVASNVKGLRFGGNVGDPIFAAADGQVVYAADGLKEYGNLVLIKHIDGYITAYAHNNRMLVKSGQNVSAGQQIAEMGSSGATRTMLEFQVRLDGKPINPANILPIN